MKPERIPILLYHSISNDIKPRFEKFTVSRERFREQMTFLKENGYSPITVSTFREGVSRHSNHIPTKPILLTFDDGLLDFYEEAYPILKDFGFPATLYSVVDYVNSQSLWLETQGSVSPMVNWAQLRELSSNGIECGSHSLTHPQLDLVSVAIARKEILDSKNILEDHLGREVLSFAYPYGYFTSAVRNLVKESGYTSACAVKYSYSSKIDDLFSLSRLLITGNTNLPEFSRVVSGKFSWYGTAYYRARAIAWWIVRKFFFSQ